MVRLFDTHVIRKHAELDGMWEFSLNENERFEYSLPVPGCWEQHPDFRTYRGKGTYRKEIFVDEKTNICLEFKGVSHSCEVFFDGVSMQKHYNAFTPFRVYIADVSSGTHEIRVCVDNSFGEHSALHIPNDYYTYGGITRPVSVEYLPEVFIENIRFSPKCINGVWCGTIVVNVRNFSDKYFKGELKYFFDGNSEFAFDNIELNPYESKEIVTSAEFSDVKPWEVLKPQLYYLDVRLCVDSVVIDDYIERIGFREIEVAGKRFFLNGREVFFKGFNRHEDHSIFGCAIPLQIMAEDIELILKTGANAIRTSHYPNDERFLDLCDERGILVWEENHARALSLERMQNPNFDRQCRDCINEMIINHYNHPSIVIWGILNECASETEIGRTKYIEQFEQIKKLDKTRPTSFATCQHFKDICLDLPDIISVNLYPLWYDETSPEECLSKELEWIESKNQGEKPVIISEVGAGGIYGYRSDTAVRWTEERQQIILDEVLEKFVNNSEICGVYIWQFCDCRVTEEEWFMVRPKTRNNKGIVDGYRRKKLAYDTVKKHFGGI